MMRRDWLFFSLILTAPAIGCGSGAGTGNTRFVTDSAGIEIVTIRPPDDLRAMESAINTAPRIDIGAIDGPDALVLSQVIGAVQLSDGRIVVGNGGTRELRFFAPNGAFSRSVGREGEGPGEFRSLDFLGLLGSDTIAVYDGRLRRISLFDGAGDFLASCRLSAAGLPYVVGALGSKSLVAWHFTGADDEQLGIYTAPMEFGTVYLPDCEFRVAGTVPSSEEARVRYRGRVTRAFRPFGRESDVAAGGDFFYVLTSSDDRSIRVYDSAGMLTRILRLEISRQAVDAAAVDTWVESWMVRFSSGSEEIEAWWRHGFRETPPPDRVPGFRSLEVDAEGNICAERYPLRWDAVSRYWCFSPDGHLVRILRLPKGLLRQGPHAYFDPQLTIAARHVLGVWEDAFEVQNVRLYAIGQ